MPIIISVCLGVVQGLTEFLPVSSSGHLVLAQKLFGSEPDLFTNVALHCGTLLAVLIFYRKQIAALIKKPFGAGGVWLITATIPTVVIAVAVKFLLPDALGDALLPVGFAITVFLLLTSEFFRRKKPAPPRAVNALAAGLAQGVSVLPGLSRSGATICAMRMAGMDGKKAVELSFLMSVPVIIGSIIFMCFDVSVSAAPVDFVSLAAGTLASGATGYFALKFLKKIADGGSLSAFGYYTLFPFLLSCVIY